MDDKLLGIVKDAYNKGASKEELDIIVDFYNKNTTSSNTTPSTKPAPTKPNTASTTKPIDIKLPTFFPTTEKGNTIPISKINPTTPTIPTTPTTPTTTPKTVSVEKKVNPLEITMDDNLYSTVGKLLKRWNIGNKDYTKEEQNKALEIEDRKLIEIKQPTSVDKMVNDQLKTFHPEMYGNDDFITPIDVAAKNYNNVIKNFKNVGYNIEANDEGILELKNENIDPKTFEKNKNIVTDKFDNKYNELNFELKEIQNAQDDLLKNYLDARGLEPVPGKQEERLNLLKDYDKSIKDLKNKINDLNKTKSDFTDLLYDKVNDFTKPIPSNLKNIFNNTENVKDYDGLIKQIRLNNANLQVVADKYNQYSDKDLTKFHLERGIELKEVGNYKQRDTQLDQVNWGWARDYEQPKILSELGRTYQMSDLQQQKYIYQSINSEIKENKNILESVKKQKNDLINKLAQTTNPDQKNDLTFLITELSNYEKTLNSVVKRDQDYENNNLSALKTELANKQEFEDFAEKNLQTSVSKIGYTILKETLELPSEVVNVSKRVGASFADTEEKERGLLSLVNNEKLGVINKYANPTTKDSEGKIVPLKDAEAFHIPKDISNFKDWSWNGEAASYQSLKAMRDMFLLGGAGAALEGALGRQSLKAFAATQVEKMFIADALAEGAGGYFTKQGARQIANVGMYGLLSGSAEAGALAVRGGSMVLPSILLFGDEIYNSYIEQGFDPIQANKLAFLQSSIEGVTESIFGNEIALYKGLIGEGIEEGVEKFSKELLEKALKERFMKSTGRELSPKGLSLLMKLGVGSKKILNGSLAKSALEGLKTTFEEVGEEEIGLILNSLITNPLAKSYKPDYEPSESLDAQNMLSTAINTAATMLIPGARTAYAYNKNSKVEALNAKFITGKSFDLSTNIVMDLLKDGTIDQEEAERRLTLVKQYNDIYKIANSFSSSPKFSNYTKDQKNNLKKQVFKEILTKSQYEAQLQFAITDKERNNILESIDKVDEGLNTLLSSGLFKTEEDRVNNTKVNLALYFNPRIINTYTPDVVKRNIEDLEFERNKEDNKDLYENYTEAINNLKQYNPLGLRLMIEADLKEIEEKSKPVVLTPEEENKLLATEINKPNNFKEALEYIKAHPEGFTEAEIDMYSNVKNVKEQQNVLAEAQKHYEETYGKKEKPVSIKQEYIDQISSIEDVKELEQLQQKIVNDEDADEFSEELYKIISNKIENIENKKNIVIFDNKQYTIGSFVRIKGEGDKLYEVIDVDNNGLKVQFLGGKTTRNVSDPKDIMSTLSEEEGKKEISKKAKEKAKEKAVADKYITEELRKSVDEELKALEQTTSTTDAKADLVQTYEYKGKTQTVKKETSTKDGITKVTFTGERSDKPGITSKAGYVYGGPTSNSVQQFFDDYGVTTEDIAEDLSIDDIKAITILEERTGEGKTTITIKISYSEEMGGMSSEPIEMAVKKQKFTSDAELAALEGTTKKTEEKMKEEKKESEDTLNISTENKNEALKDKEFIEESIKLSENKSPEDILKELEKSNKEKC